VELGLACSIAFDQESAGMAASLVDRSVCRFRNVRRSHCAVIHLAARVKRCSHSAYDCSNVSALIQALQRLPEIYFTV